MSFKNRINVLRRKVMAGLTQNVGSSHEDKPIHIADPALVKRILVCRPNHRLGNLLLLTPYLQELETAFPNATIDLFVKGGLGPIVFKNYPRVGNIISLPKKPTKEPGNYFRVWASLKKHRYDLVINIDHKSSSGRIATQLARSENKIFGENSNELPYDDALHMAKNPVYALRENIPGLPTKGTPIPPLSLKLSAAEIAGGAAELKKIVPNDRPTIAIFTYATGSKCYPPEWWIPFYALLQSTFPGYNIVEVLPVENVSQINFTAPSFYSKDVREIGAFIANTKVFIGADSGIMHLAFASGVPTIGLFSVYHPGKYGPYGPGNVAIDTNTGSQEAIIEVVKNVLA